MRSKASAWRWRCMVMIVPQIKRILFPVDFSPACLGAARYVEALAGRVEAEVMLLHVVQPGAHSRAEDLLTSRRDQLTAFGTSDLRYFSTRTEFLFVCVLVSVF